MANCAPDSETAEDPKERFGGCSISFLAPPPPGVLTTRKQKNLTTILSSWLLSHIAQKVMALQPFPFLSQHTAWREHHCSRNALGEKFTLSSLPVPLPLSSADSPAALQTLPCNNFCYRCLIIF